MTASWQPLECIIIYMFRLLLLALASVSANAAQQCDATGNAAALRGRAAELYEQGDHQTADACISTALLQVTKELEVLASQAQALRAFAEARKRSPAVVPASGCVVDASGNSVCLPDLAATSGSISPETAAECGSEATALTLLSSKFEGGAAVAAPTELQQQTPLDAFIVQSAQRHWWVAAKRAVDVLRAQNMPPHAETRRAVTELRDESGALLALMRQTKMDEATISCAVMWAQGTYSVHLNVKFASRLDAPVTVLNVDNEVVEITETRVTFSGIGRQKPKRYVIDLELYAPIDPNASSWSFGSVGTVRFQLVKKDVQRWERLTASNESVKNHRVWWEKQDQVEKADRQQKEASEKAEREREKAEKDREKEEKEAAARLEREETERALQQAKVERRALQKPVLDTAIAAVDALATVAVDEGSAAGGADQQLLPTKQASVAAATALLSATGHDTNETAVAAAEQMAAAIVSLRSTGFAALTKDALDSAVKQFKEWLESHVEPEPPAPPPPPQKKGKSKKKKKAAKKE